METPHNTKPTVDDLSISQLEKLQGALARVCETWGAILTHAAHCIYGCQARDYGITINRECTQYCELENHHRAAYHNYRMTLAGVAAELHAHTKHAERFDPDLQGEKLDD